MKRLLLLLLALSLTPFAYPASGQILPPHQAFPASAQAPDGSTVTVHWDIPPNYYLYAKSFSFASGTPGISLGTPNIPPAKTDNDPFLGRVKVFTNPVTIRVPIERTATAPNILTLKATARGCQRNVVCYPPFTQTLKISLPAMAAAPDTATNVLAALTGNAGNAGNGQFLPADKAFALSVSTAGPDRLVAHWNVAPGYHLYRDQIKFSLENAAGLGLGKINMPPGKTLNIPYLGRQVVYPGPFDIALPIARAANAGTTGTLVVRYQGCADKGICYPPIVKTIPFTLTSGTNGSPPTATSSTSAVKNSGGGNEQDRLARFLLHKPLWMSLGLFFIIGLGLAFTPCIFPLFPILSGIIVGQKETPSTSRTFVLSLVYVLAMALTYTIVGVIVGLTGAGIQAWFQNPWVLSAFAAIFVLLSLSMFGFYDLQMPHGIQSRLTEISNRQQGGTLFGVAIMGFLSALIVGPCVTAPLVAALIVIANTGNAVLGGLSLFALSMGMGLPLLIVCTACGRFLPRAGAWMDAIKGVFGVLMLAVAIWMLARFLPAWATATLTALLLIASGVYLGALEPVPAERTGWAKLWKATGLVSLLWGSLILVGIAAGGASLLTPLSGVFDRGAPIATSTQNTGHTLRFKRVKNLQALKTALTAANGRPVMLDFYADWCVSCKELEAETFSNPSVKKALSGFVLLQADVTSNNGADQALLKHFGLFGPPGIIFIGPNGQEKRNLRVVGFMSAGRFLKNIEQAQ